MQRIALFIFVGLLGVVSIAGIALAQVSGGTTGGTTGSTPGDSTAPLEGEPVDVEGDNQLNGGDALTIEGSYKADGDAKVTLIDEDDTVGTLTGGDNAQFETGDEKLTIRVTGDPTAIVGGNGILNTAGLKVRSSEGVQAEGDQDNAGPSTAKSTETSTETSTEEALKTADEPEREPEQEPPAGATTIIEEVPEEEAQAEPGAATTVIITREESEEETTEETHEETYEETYEEETTAGPAAGEAPSEQEDARKAEKPTPVVEEPAPVDPEDTSGPVFVENPDEKPVLPDTGGMSLVGPATLCGLSILVVGCLYRRGS